MKIKYISYEQFLELLSNYKVRVYQERLAYFVYLDFPEEQDPYVIESDNGIGLDGLAKLNEFCLKTKNDIALKDSKDYTEDELRHSIPTSECLPNTDWD